MRKNETEKAAVVQKCFDLASQARWQQFITFYYKAYDDALRKMQNRIHQKLRENTIL
jgi:hypothetical protein